MSTKALFAHVPVDKIEILWLSVSPQTLYDFMFDDANKKLETRTKLRTPASSKVFNRGLEITWITSVATESLAVPLHLRTTEPVSLSIEFHGNFCGYKIQGTLWTADVKRQKIRGEFKCI